MYSNCVIKGIVNNVHCRKRGKDFVKNFAITSELSGSSVSSSAWSNSVPNIESIKDGAYATAHGYFKTVSFTRKDGSQYSGREFVVKKIVALPDYELALS